MFEYSPAVLQIITIVGGITCLFAASIALAQSDIKKIIAYSTCSQLGYMFLACGVSAYQAGIFHLVTHAFFKALLFLSAGSVIHACHEQDIFKMGNLRKKLPLTYLNFWIGSLAIIGIFPLAGYYSKDLILESAYLAGQNGHLAFWMGIIAAVFTALYSMKIIILTFHGETKLSAEAFEHAHESPIIMNLPLVVLIIGALIAGIIGANVLHMSEKSGYFGNSLFYLNLSQGEHILAKNIELLPLIVGITGILVGIYAYQSKLANKVSGSFPVIAKILRNKYYFDELYKFIIVRPLGTLSKISSLFDKNIIDGFGPNAFAKLTNFFGWCISELQTGYIFNYALVIILAIASCITFFVINFVRILG
jgi:NADH-quinone oxidoreductase subunit L